ncbi:hypothetical protein [Litorivivens sp.]|uniref:hypothetical protein n=1 Tax=Litorivivens sp. TaxID=2020868 RepID=UPI0035642C28
MLPLRAKAAVLVALLAAAGWIGWEWRDRSADLEITELRLSYEKASNKALEASQALADASARVAKERAAAFESGRQEGEANAKVIVKEVIRYEKAEYSGRCDLSNHWVRLDTAAATGVRPDTVTTGGSDDAASGVTDADALAVSTERSAIYHAEVRKLRALQEYVNALPEQCRVR